MPALAQTVAATSKTIRGNFNWRENSTIRLPENGDQVRVQIVAPTQFDARQMLQLQYDDAEILFGPNRVDLMRAV